MDEQKSEMVEFFFVDPDKLAHCRQSFHTAAAEAVAVAVILGFVPSHIDVLVYLTLRITT